MPKGHYYRSPDELARISEHMVEVHRRWMSEDPDGRSAVSHIGGVKATSLVWQCDDCGFVARGPSIGNHQKFKGHEGRTLIDTIHPEGEPA